MLKAHNKIPSGFLGLTKIYIYVGGVKLCRDGYKHCLGLPTRAKTKNKPGTPMFHLMRNPTAGNVTKKDG